MWKQSIFITFLCFFVCLCSNGTFELFNGLKTMYQAYVMGKNEYSPTDWGYDISDWFYNIIDPLENSRIRCARRTRNVYRETQRFLKRKDAQVRAYNSRLPRKTTVAGAYKCDYCKWGCDKRSEWARHVVTQDHKNHLDRVQRDCCAAELKVRQQPHRHVCSIM